MSVGAYWPREFQPWRSCMVADRLIRKRAATIDPSGFSPEAPSRVALRTKYPARIGTNLATMIWLTKFLKIVSILANQLVPTDPLAEGTVMPCAAIHDTSGGTVSKRTVH